MKTSLCKGLQWSKQKNASFVYGRLHSLRMDTQPSVARWQYAAHLTMRTGDVQLEIVGDAHDATGANAPQRGGSA
jgi:hypothetical protein